MREEVRIFKSRLCKMNPPYSEAPRVCVSQVVYI